MGWNYKIIVFSFLAFVTIVCHSFIQRYEKNGHEMLSDNWSFYTPKNGKAWIKDNELHLFSRDKGKSVSIQQNILSFVHGSILELSADMKCSDVSPGKKSWNHARFMLVQQDGRKDRWDIPYRVASLTGSRKWQRYTKVFTIGHDIKKIRVSAQLSRCTGSFQLRNIHFFYVNQTHIYTWVKTGILISWAVFAVFLMGSWFYCCEKTIALRVMLALAFIAIIAGTAMPGNMKAQVLKGVKSDIHATGGVLKNTTPWDLSKIGHFCFFAVFALIFSVMLGRRSILLVILNILLVAGGTELSQLFIDGRTPLFRDFVIDLTGGFTGISLVSWFGCFV